MELTFSMSIVAVFLLLLCTPAVVKARCWKDETVDQSGSATAATTATTSIITTDDTTSTAPTTNATTATFPTTAAAIATESLCNCDDLIQCCYAGVQCRLRPPAGEECGVHTCPCLEGTCEGGVCKA